MNVPFSCVPVMIACDCLASSDMYDMFLVLQLNANRTSTRAASSGVTKLYIPAVEPVLIVHMHVRTIYHHCTKGIVFQFVAVANVGSLDEYM